MRIRSLAALAAAAMATRVPVPLPLTERPLEQQPVGRLAGVEALATNPVSSSSGVGGGSFHASDSRSTAASRTPGELLLDPQQPLEPFYTSGLAKPALEEATMPAVSAPPPPVASASEPRHHRRPPSPPRAREVPLLGNLTMIGDVSSRYVRTHFGVEVACALLLAALLSLCALGCVVRAFCDYSLCCFSRGVKRAKLTSPRAEFA